MPEWRKNAECLNLDLELFFDDYEDHEETAEFVDSVCHSCPVRRECLQYAVDNDATGVWGAMYLMLGSYSRSRNTHKNKQQMREEAEYLDKFTKNKF